MASYTYTANGNAQASGNIATDKVRIATTTSAIQFVASYPNVAATGTVSANTASNLVVGSGTTFTSQLKAGYWIGNATGTTAGIVHSIQNDGNLTLVANSAVVISSANITINPFGVPYTVATANSEIIPANTVERSIIVGQGNIVSFLDSTSDTPAPFSITELGMPHQTPLN